MGECHRLPRGFELVVDTIGRLIRVRDYCAMGQSLRCTDFMFCDIIDLDVLEIADCP